MQLGKFGPVILTILPCLSIFVNAASQLTKAASCTSSSYPGFVTDTTNQNQAFYLTVASSNPLNNGHNVQLRADPSTPGASLVVVDAFSPVLALQMRNGSLYSQAMDTLQDLGPVGGLRNITTNTKAGYAEEAFIFRNLTGAGASFKQSQGGWQLVGGGNAAQYNLYQKAPLDVANGFLLCPQTDKGEKYFQAFYEYYDQNPPNFPGCDYVAIQTDVNFISDRTVATAAIFHLSNQITVPRDSMTALVSGSTTVEWLAVE